MQSTNCRGEEVSKIQGKCVVITGASGGIGKEIARRSASLGAKVVLLARNYDALLELKEELIKEYGTEAYAYQLDVGDSGKVGEVFREIYENAGEIDVLVNNAGYGVFKEADETDMKETEDMFRVNVFGLMAATQMVLPGMKRRQSGHIINIASQAGKMATPKSSLYSSTKFAVLGYSNALRMELKRDHVFVTTVNPGPIQTNFFNIADESGSYTKNIEKFMLNPQYVAIKVVGSMFTGKREINLPGWMNAASRLHNLFPKTVETIGKRAFFKK
jgi:uncharacterized protein